MLAATEGMRGAMAEMETAFRGFALSGEPRFRDAWSGARAISSARPQRRGLLADDPRQEARWRAAQAGLMPGAGSDAATVAAAGAGAADPAGFRTRREAADRVLALLNCRFTQRR